MTDYSKLTKEEVVKIAERLDKKVEDLNSEIKAYEKFKDELEFSLEEKNREIETYLNVINRYVSKDKTEDNNIDIGTDYRISKLEDEVREIRGDLGKITKIITSTKNTLNEFLSRIYE